MLPRHGSTTVKQQGLAREKELKIKKAKRREKCLERFNLQTQNYEKKISARFYVTLCLSLMSHSDWPHVRMECAQQIRVKQILGSRGYYRWHSTHDLCTAHELSHI